MENLDFGYCFEKGKKLFKQGKYFEARSYLKRAYLIWPWHLELKRLLEEIEKKIRESKEGSYAGDKTRDGFEI
ncbi:MAG: hypothetical protein ACPLN0_00600 [Candidatus Hydrothermia bacterium]